MTNIDDDEDNPILDAMNDSDFVKAVVLDEAPAERSDVVVIPDSSHMVMPRGDFVDERDPAIIEREKTFEFVKNNIKDVIPTIAEAASDTLAIAKMLSSADHAAAGSSLLGQYLAAQKALIAVEKTQDDLRHRDMKGSNADAPTVQNQTLNVFAGTTAELQRIMKELKIGKDS